MQTKTFLNLALSSVITILCTFAFAAEPMLNGIALHSDLSKEQFIGALYSNPLSNNPDTVLNSTQAMRMELKIVTPEGLPTRRFSRWWIEGMGINHSNNPALLTEQADNVVKFDGLFKGRFAQNDHIVFSYEPSKGMNVLVNDVLLGNIASEKFFGMILKTWIGRVPFSSDFKDGVLKNGAVNADLKKRFDSIKPTKERIADVVGWTKIKPGIELASEKDTTKTSSSHASSTDNTKLVAAQKTEQAKAEAAKLEAAKLAAQKASAANKSVAKSSDDDEDRPVLTAQTLLARQFYVSDLLKKIFTLTRYPKRALERNQEGSVRVAVIIDRQGNIISTSILQSSEYTSFNDAALDAVNKAAPYPKIPDAISGATFEFTAPIKFTLPKEES